MKGVVLAAACASVALVRRSITPREGSTGPTVRGCTMRFQSFVSSRAVALVVQQSVSGWLAENIVPFEAHVNDAAWAAS